MTPAPRRSFLLFALSLMAVGALVVTLQILTAPSVRADDDHKVTVCHNANSSQQITITVDEHAVDAHIENHGDVLGPCEGNVVENTPTEAPVVVNTNTPVTNGATATSVPETATSVPATATNVPLQVVTNTPTTQATVVSGAQGGGVTQPQQQQQPVQEVAGAMRLPATGGGAGSSSNGMLYFGIALILLGAGLGGTGILLARR